MQENAKVLFKNKKFQIYGGIFILLAVVALSLYSYGYRFKNNLTLGKVGTLSITIPMPLTSIFIDESRKITTSKDNEVVNLTFSPTKHSVIVSRDGYFPWKKDFVIESGKTTTIYPILVSQNATGEIITKNDKDYWTIRNKVVTDVLPTKDNPGLSADGSVSIWVEDNAIMAKVGNEIKKVIQPDTIIRNVYFYKDRSDAVMFSTLGSIFIIEIDDEGEQNFLPVYRGQKPIFIKTDPNFIYVLDAENLMQVII